MTRSIAEHSRRIVYQIEELFQVIVLINCFDIGTSCSTVCYVRLFTNAIDGGFMLRETEECMIVRI